MVQARLQRKRAGDDAHPGGDQHVLDSLNLVDGAAALLALRCVMALIPWM
jgi:hypothetical protein